MYELFFKNNGGCNGRERKNENQREKENRILIEYYEILWAAELKAPYNK